MGHKQHPFPLWYAIDDAKERSHARTNVLRALDIPSGVDVLEIGSGFGLTTDYLAHFANHVTVLNSEEEHHRVTGAHTQHKSNVTVIHGNLTDLPNTRYDIIVFLGSFNSGALDVSEFLTDLQARLHHNGTLILGAANSLGIRYLVGAPGELSREPFGDIEAFDYRPLSPAKLEHLLRSVGFPNIVRLSALPDHSSPRLVANVGRIPTHATDLLVNIPSFPSPDHESGATRVGDEERFWQTFVEAGLAGEVANSHVFIAKNGSAESSIWPDHHVLTYYSDGRKAAFSTDTAVVAQEDQLIFQRRARVPSKNGAAYFVQDSDELYTKGVPLVEVAAHQGFGGIEAAIKQWHSMVKELDPEGPLPLDLVPHNLLLKSDGSIHVVDQEWYSYQHSPSELIKRGILLFVQQVAVAKTRLRGVDVIAPRTLAAQMARVVGLPEPEVWIDSTISSEALFYETVLTERGGLSKDERIAEYAHAIRNSLTEIHFGSASPDGPSEEDREAWFRAPTSNIYSLRLHLLEATKAVDALTQHATNQDRLITTQREHIENQDARIVELEAKVRERSSALGGILRKVGRPVKRVLRKLLRR